MMNVSRFSMSLAWLGLLLTVLVNRACAETEFVEVEARQSSSDGWW